MTPRSWRRRFAPLLLAIAVVGAGGCSDDDDNDSPSEPQNPTPTVISETFSGSLVAKGNNAHNFTVNVTGDTEIRITSLAPLDTLGLGVGIGPPDATLTPACRIFGQDSNAHLNERFLTEDLAPGAYCVSVRDVGNIFTGVTVTYQVRVDHT